MWKLNLIVLVLFLHSCSEKKNVNIIENVETIPWNISTDKSTSNPFKKMLREYIFLSDTPDDKMLSNIQEIIYNKGKLFARDNKRVNIYDERGKYINSIGDIGRASNEYIQVDDISIMSDTIYILDSAVDKLIIYDINGKFIGTKTVPISLISGFATTKQGFILYRPIYQGDDANKLNEYAITFTDRNCNIQSQLINYDEDSPTINNGTPFIETDSLVLFNLFLTDQVYIVNRDDLSRQVLDIDFKSQRIPTGIRTDNESVFSPSSDYYYLTCTPVVDGDLLIGKVVRKRKVINFAINLTTKEVFEDNTSINLYPPFLGKLNDYFLTPIEYNKNNDDLLSHSFPDSVNEAVINGDIVILKFRQDVD